MTPEINYSDEVTEAQLAALKEIEDSLHLEDGTWEQEGGTGW